MKSFLVFILIFFIANVSYSQLSKGGTPYSLQASFQNSPALKSSLKDTLIVKEPLLNDVADEKGMPFLFAKSVAFNLNLKSKTPIDLKEGKLWVWHFYAKNAQTLNTYFSKFKLMEGAKLFVYRSDGRQILGAFTSENNQDHNSLSVGYVESNDIIIEYFEPNNILTNKSEIELGVIGYGFREGFNRFNETKINESDDCNININCPAGADYQDVKKAVAKILFQRFNGNWYICSGSLINNTLQNGTPYFLTAFHCYEESNVNTYIFYFNYESPNCNNPTTVPASNTLSGCTVKATYSNSDFALVQINNSIPQSYNVFYAGWDNTDSVPTSTVGIHHPSGDVKKIAIDNNPPTKSNASTWTVSWDLGITEGGSSGSMLINSSTKNIIGQLLGGYSFCNTPQAPDIYGRFAISWTGGGTPSTRLRDWLDPNNSNATSLNGIFYGTVSCLPSDTIFCQGQNMSVNYIATGTYNAGNIFTVQLSNAAGSFATPINIGSLASTASTGTISVTIPANTISGAGYRIRIVASKPSIIGSDNGSNLIVINNPPAQPANFTTSTSSVCRGQNNVIYSIPAVAGATSYTWAYSGDGATISGTGTMVIVNFSNSATIGVLSVVANNACGGGSPRGLNINVSPLPAQPSAFTTSTSTVCQGQNNVTYTIPATSAATSYTWSYSGEGATINGTGTSVTINFSNRATSGTLSVVGNNSCGSGLARTMAIEVRENSSGNLTGTQTITSGQTATLTSTLTGTPPWIIGINGQNYNVNSSPFQLSVTPTTTTTYTLTNVTNFCSSITPNTANTAVITVTPSVSVTGTSFCAGASVSVGFNGTGTFGSGNVFVAQLSNSLGSFASPVNIGSVTSTTSTGTINATIPLNTVAGTGYRIRIISSNPITASYDNGTNLTINTPANATLSGTQTIVSGQAANLTATLTGTSPWTIVVNGTTTSGIATSPFTVQVSPSAGVNTYTLTSVSNVCGTTTVTGNNSATVAVNSQTISTNLTGTEFCKGQSINVNYVATGTYNAGNVFTVQLSNSFGSFTSPVNIGSITSTAATGTINAVIPSSLILGPDYRLRIVSSTPSVTGTMNSSELRIIDANPTQPANFTTSLSSVCQGQSNVIYSIPAVAGATGYTWTYSGEGVSIIGSGTSVTLNFSSTASMGVLSVVANNNCGSSPPRGLTINVSSLPAQPGAFTTSTSTVCQGQNNVAYTIPTTSAASSYTWSYTGEGVTINGTGTNVTINFSDRATSGILRVVGNNSCGSGLARTMAIEVREAPSAKLTGTQTIGLGQTATLTSTLTGTAPWTITINGQNYNVNSSPFQLSVSPTTTTNYTLTSVSNFCNNITQNTPNAATITVSHGVSITGTSFCAGTNLSVGYNGIGTFGPGNILIAQLSNSSGSFAAPVNIGSITSTATTGTINATIPLNTVEGTGYRIRVISSNPSITGSDNGNDLTINVSPNATLTGTQTILNGQTANLTTTLTGTSPWTIVINGNTTSGITTSPYILQVSPNIGVSTYTLSSVSNVCGTTTVNENNSATVTVNRQMISASLTGADFCVGQNISVAYAATGIFNSGNIFTVQLSDLSGSFLSPVSIGSISSTAATGTINATIPVNGIPGTGYRIRVVSSNQVLIGDVNGNNLKIHTPANATLSGTQTIVSGQTSNLTVTLTGTAPWGITINGNTTSGITTNPYTIPVSPAVGVSTYTLSSVSNACGTTTVNANNSATVTVIPQTISTNVTGNAFCAGGNVTVGYSTNGTFNLTTVLRVQLSNASGSFAVPTIISSVTTNITTGTFTVQIPLNIPAGTGYRLRVNAIEPNIIGSDNGNNLTIYTLPTATLLGTQTINAGQSANLTANLTGSSPWTITVRGQNYGVSSSPYQFLVTPTTTTTYTLTSVSNMCGNVTPSTANTVTVTVNQPAACDNDFNPALLSNTNGICPNELAVLRVLDSPFGANYSWSLNNGTIANQTSPVLITNQIGTYQAQLTPTWYQVEPTTTNENLNNITFINDFVGFIVGEKGTILNTQDAGENWSKVFVGNSVSSADLKDIHFTTSNDGWIVGHNNTLIKSITGGISWESQPIGINGNAIDFFDKSRGAIVGTNGVVKYTADGGQIWNTATSEVSNHLNDVKFVSANIVFAVGDAEVLIKSTDGGQTWSGITTGVNSNFKRIYFFNEMIGWIVGSNNTVLKTTDGGMSWNSVATGITNGGSALSWQDISFISPSTGWLVDGGNSLAKTTDGGNTWSLATQFNGTSSHGITINQCSKLYFSKTSQNGFVIGWAGAIAKTNDLGNSWSVKSDGISKNANDIQFIDDNNLISVGNNALVQKSTDKGKTWAILSATGLAASDWLQASHFVNLTTGWTISNDGDIFFTNDGGHNWTKQRNAPSVQLLYDIHMLSATKGYVVGGEGLFLETTDGGMNWSSRSLGYSGRLQKIFFINNSIGWICGQNGLISKTNDGGTTWQQQTTNTTAQLSSIFFLNSQVGWAVVSETGNHSILKTTDGGTTWNIVATTPSYVTDIVFKNVNEGYICGGNGYMATTTNGGITWQTNNQLSFSELSKLAVNTIGVVVGVGINNTILRYNSNACTVNTNTVNINDIGATSNLVLTGVNTVSPYATKSATEIQSSQVLGNGQSIKYRAIKSITLTPGFNTANQTNFKAEIRGCNN